ncbi:MAG: hypothetical protein ACRC5R_05205 [Mycoplasmatales bacterium]
MKISIKLMLNKYGLSFFMLGFSFIIINILNPYLSKVSIITVDLVVFLTCFYIMKSFGMNRPDKSKRQVFETVMTFIMFISTFLIIMSNDDTLFFQYGIYVLLMSGLYLLFTISTDKFIKKLK